ncbi:MAG: cation transporter, partial [Bacteroidota bacterium]
MKLTEKREPGMPNTVDNQHQSNRTANRRNRRLMQLVLLVGVLITAVKFLAFALTSSNAIFSDALESIVNLFTGGFAIYSLWLASLPRDNNHPYGHGKIEF